MTRTPAWFSPLCLYLTDKLLTSPIHLMGTWNTLVLSVLLFCEALLGMEYSQYEAMFYSTYFTSFANTLLFVKYSGSWSTPSPLMVTLLTSPPVLIMLV